MPNLEHSPVKTPSFSVIPTVYHGIDFRSRQEARWALFMDLIGVRWTYEPEGYDIEGTKYLPDFFLHRQDCFLEIKVDWPTQQEDHKAESLAMATGKLVFLYHGPVALPAFEDHDHEGAISYCRCKDGQPGQDFHHLWCECKKCGHCELQFDGRSSRNSCCRPKDWDGCGDKGYNSDCPKLVRAYSLAAAERWFDV